MCSKSVIYFVHLLLKASVVIQIFSWFTIFQTSLNCVFLSLAYCCNLEPKKYKSNWFEKFKQKKIEHDHVVVVTYFI